VDTASQWVWNPLIDATSAENRKLVVEALQGGNIAFGLHRWYYGGSAPDFCSIGAVDEWDAEIARGRPGDNLMIVSLESVSHQKILRQGHPVLGGMGSLASDDLGAAWRFLESSANEIVAITRHISDAGEVVSSIELVWDPDAVERDRLFEEWRGLPGELWLFDMSVIWQDESDRKGIPREQWTAQHQQFLVDVYIPDQQGRVPTGGAY